VWLSSCRTVSFSPPGTRPGSRRCRLPSKLRRSSPASCSTRVATNDLVTLPIRNRSLARAGRLARRSPRPLAPCQVRSPIRTSPTTPASTTPSISCCRTGGSVGGRVARGAEEPVGGAVERSSGPTPPPRRPAAARPPAQRQHGHRGSSRARLPVRQAARAAGRQPPHASGRSSGWWERPSTSREWATSSPTASQKTSAPIGTSHDNPNSPSVAALVSSGQTDPSEDAVTQCGMKPLQPQCGPEVVVLGKAVAADAEEVGFEPAGPAVRAYPGHAALIAESGL